MDGSFAGGAVSLWPILKRSMQIAELNRVPITCDTEINTALHSTANGVSQYLLAITSPVSGAELKAGGSNLTI